MNQAAIAGVKAAEVPAQKTFVVNYTEGRARTINARLWTTSVTGSKPRHTPEEIKEALQPMVRETCEWSKKANAPMQRLQGSRKRAYAEIKGQINIQYRQFCRKLEHQGLGISSARRRVDICSACDAWDRTTSKELEHLISEGEKECKAHCKLYVDLFKSIELPKGKARVESIKYLDDLANIVEQHNVNCEKGEDCNAAAVGGHHA